MIESLKPNLPELTVSEISVDIKKTLETSFDYVRVRGELGRVSRPKSGHLYADIKDDKAVLSLVMFKNMMGGLAFQPEQGLEVVVEGRISAFGGQSKYQLIAKKIVPAGEGALMALLEKRKKSLMAEGLMDAARKKPLPFLPKIIGVVTSPSGAVLRDILHRVRDRMPTQVIVWPSLVQGENAAGQVARGIRGFNAMRGATRPDVIIVARGGGSFEDLWAFNEEEVVRAAADSDIPLVSAIGHETDNSLLDLVADMRAATPTAAAEIVVPVRAELLHYLRQVDQRAKSRLARLISEKQRYFSAQSLPTADRILLPYQSRIAVGRLKLAQAPSRALQIANSRLMDANLSPNLISSLLEKRQRQFQSTQGRLRVSAAQFVSKTEIRARTVFARLRLDLVAKAYQLKREKLEARDRALETAYRNLISGRGAQLSSLSNLLVALSHKSTLARGYAILRSESGEFIGNADDVVEGQMLSALVAQGAFSVRVEPKNTSKQPPEISSDANVEGPEVARPKAEKLNIGKAKPASKTPNTEQGKLF